MSVFDSFSLQGRVALVTGASSGLGRHFAATLAAAGAFVWVAARRAERLAALVDELQQQGRAAAALGLDVTDEASVRAAFARMAEQASLPDVVVNNAGTSAFKPALQQTAADWDAVVQTNLRGAWLVATEAARHLTAASRPGNIVNVASILAVRVAGGVAPYCASKAGLAHLTQALALEWARYGIRVNAIAPGYIATDLNREFLQSEAGEKMRLRIPQRRFGAPRDLDGPLLLLASDAGRFMTGALIAADGGHLLSTV
ncbi:MAG TPA: SDR family oxidoreductase [Nevskia sp.]|nr:SDR family oxidoreductase [Nevskia sp.]